MSKYRELGGVTMAQEFDRERYKAWTWKHPLLLHWVPNPALAFNELVLGQRIPKLTLIDKQSKAPLMERTYVPCPHCETLNDGRIWGRGNAFGHWFGYVCPECGGRIPCLWNISSLVILAITFPAWFWAWKFGRDSWLQRERRRAGRVSSQLAGDSPESGKAVRKPSFLLMGIVFGTIMFCVMTLPGYLRGEMAPEQVALGFGTWMLAGLLFGGLIWFFTGRRKA